MKAILLVLFAVVIISPAAATTTNLTPFADAFTDQNQPNSNNGVQTYVAIFGQNPWREYGYVNFSLPVMTSLSNATLNLTGDHAGISSITIRRVTSAWNETGITWNNQPTTTTTNQVTVSINGFVINQSIEINVTNLVNDIIANGNHGFAVIPTYSPSDWDFYSRTGAHPPRLNLTYTTSPLSTTYLIDYNYGCNTGSGGADILANKVPMFLIVVLVIFIVLIARSNHDGAFMELLIMCIVVIIVGGFMPSITDAASHCGEKTGEPFDIAGMQDTDITLTHTKMLSGSETVYNGDYTAVRGTDYTMDYEAGTIRPLSTGGMFFGS